MKKYTLLTLIAALLTLHLSAQELTAFSTGTAYHYLWGFKDAAGNVVVEPKYSQCPQFQDGFAIAELNDKIGLLNRAGKEITPLKYDNAYSFCYDGLFELSLAGKHGYVDTFGKEVIPFIYNDAKDFSSGRAYVSVGEKHFFIDTKGKTVITLDAFESTHEKFMEGLCGVRVAGLWGFMDVSGKVVIPCKYDDVHEMSEGFAVVIFGGKMGSYILEGGKWGFIDRTGKELTPLKYDYASPFANGLAVVNIGGVLDSYQFASEGKWGFIDKTGKEITLKYDYASSLCEGMAVVNSGGHWENDGMGGNSMEGGKWGYVDSKGNQAIALQYDKAENFVLGAATVMKDGKSISINKKGEAVIEDAGDDDDY